MKNQKNLKLVKILLLLLTIIILIFLTFKLFPLFKSLASENGRIEFKKQIDSYGSQGVFVIIGLQLLQILVPILPGEPIEFIAGMCYGSFWGMIILFIGSFLSSFIIFYCVRKFGLDFITTFCNDDKIEKIKNSKAFNDPKKIEIILLFLFLIPGTPKDLFVYLAGLLPIKPLRFFLIATFARFPSIITSTIAGANATSGNFHITIAIYAITIIVSLIGILIYNKYSKKEIIS